MTLDWLSFAIGVGITIVLELSLLAIITIRLFIKAYKRSQATHPLFDDR